MHKTIRMQVALRPFFLPVRLFLWTRQGELKRVSREDALGCKEKGEHLVLKRKAVISDSREVR
jgi:hypothetical protein